MCHALKNTLFDVDIVVKTKSNVVWRYLYSYRQWYTVVKICCGLNSAAPHESTPFWPLWWCISLSIRVQTTLNHIRFVTSNFVSVKLSEYYFIEYFQKLNKAPYICILWFYSMILLFLSMLIFILINWLLDIIFSWWGKLFNNLVTP